MLSLSVLAEFDITTAKFDDDNLGYDLSTLRLEDEIQTQLDIIWDDPAPQIPEGFKIEYVPSQAQKYDAMLQRKERLKRLIGTGLGLSIVVLVAIWLRFKKIIIETIKKLPNDNYNLFGYITIACLFLIPFIDVGLNLGIDQGFYMLLRILITLFSGWTTYKIYRENNTSRLLLLFGVLAILFNPVIKISFEQGIWLVIDAITFFTLIWWMIFYNKNKTESNS